MVVKKAASTEGTNPHKALPSVRICITERIAYPKPFILMVLQMEAGWTLMFYWDAGFQILWL